MSDEIQRPVTRRAALKVLGAVPLAGLLGSELALAQQATAPAQQPQQPRQPHETPNQPAQGGTHVPASAPEHVFFTVAERRTATRLADDIIPRDARSPSASEAGVLAFMDFHLSLPETSDDTRVGMRGGLAWLNTESRRRFGVAYAAASSADRHLLLDDIAGPAPTTPTATGMSAGTAFFARFRDMVASGFFSSAVGWKDLQYQGNVFNPGWAGCPDSALRKLGVTADVMKTRVPAQ